MLIKIRLWLYGLALSHLVFITCYLLSIDFTKVDERFQMYHHVKWKLITTWFNLLTLAYLPACMYCEWRELKGKTESTHVKWLNRIRFECFSNVILPTTLFADLMYWRLCSISSELITPKGLEYIVPFWTQHCLHTVSLVLVVLDLVLVPRKRPASLTPGISVTLAFICTYLAMVVYYKMQGEYLYPLVKTLTTIESIIFVVLVLVEHAFYYTGQWVIVDLIWRRKNNIKKIS